MNVKEVLQREPPKTLYHYTTHGGLLGIISNREIWASHTQYLNDVREFRHAIQIVEEQLSTMKLEYSLDQERIDLLGEMEEALKGIETINIRVCSFSATGDSLSQWRAYGGGGPVFRSGSVASFYVRLVTSFGFGWFRFCTT
jgi:hypothetical protein